MAKELGCADELLEQADDADDSKDAFIQLIIKARMPSQAKSANSSKKAAKKNGASEADPRCAKCGEDFPSKSKLHQHLRETDHAAPPQPPELLTKSGKAKKR